MTERFSDKKYILPFGRYVGSTEVEPPANEVLVGREGQRAYLIDLLISTGRRGAYLVTGHRGAGKTSFVKHCISEYEASVFSRFLRGNVGRGVWDRVLVLFFWLAILVGALLSTELIQFFVHSLSAGKVDLLQWLILVPIAVILLYPCVYAKVVFETCIGATRQLKTGSTKKNSDPSKGGQQQEVSRKIDEVEDRKASVTAFIVVFVLAVVVCIGPFFANPAQGVFLLMPLVCSLYATVQAVSFNLEDKPKNTLKARSWGLVSKNWSWLIYLILAVVLFGVLFDSILTSRFLCGKGMNESATGRIFQCNLALSLIFLGLGLILRGIDQKRRAGPKGSGAADAGLSVDFINSLRDAMESGARLYRLSGCIIFIAGVSFLCYLVRKQAIWSLLIPSFLFTAFLVVTKKGKDKGRLKETKDLGSFSLARYGY